MYLYFDKKGILREIINDNAIRQYSDNANVVLMYFETESVPSLITLGITQNSPTRKTLTRQIDPSVDFVNITLEYSSERTLSYFKYGKSYKFYKYALTSEDLMYSGLLTIDPLVNFVSESTSDAYGRICLVVEESNVVPTELITQGEYLNLLQELAKFNQNRINDIEALESRVSTLETKYLYRHSLNISLQGAVSVWVDIYTRNSDRLDNTNAFYQQLMTYGSVPCYENTFRIVNNNTIRSITRLRAIQGDSIHVKVSYFDITYAIVNGELQITHTAGEEDMQILTFYNEIITRIY